MAAIIALIAVCGVYYSNYLGATSGLWGMKISELGNVFPFPYMPAGLFFMYARTLIFLMIGIVALIAFQRFLLHKKYHERITRLFAFSSLLTIIWVIFTSAELYVLSVVIIALLMFVLARILDIHRRNGLQHTRGRRAFGAYYGWISMATTVLSLSILIYLYYPAFVLSSLRSYCAITIGILVTLFSRLRRRNPMALLLAVWALIGALASFVG